MSHIVGKLAALAIISATGLGVVASAFSPRPAPEYGTPIMEEPRFYSLIKTEPGIDPLSGERYDEYVMDFNLSLGDCVEAMSLHSTTAVACELQPQGMIAR